MIGADVAHQLLAGPPLLDVEDESLVVDVLENSTVDAAGLDAGRALKRTQGLQDLGLPLVAMPDDAESTS